MTERARAMWERHRDRENGRKQSPVIADDHALFLFFANDSFLAGYEQPRG
jgi:hypothetical protein